MELANTYATSFTSEYQRICPAGQVGPLYPRPPRNWQEVFTVYMLGNVQHITRLGPYYSQRGLPLARFTVKVHVNHPECLCVPRRPFPFEPPRSPRIVIAMTAGEVERMGQWMAQLVIAADRGDSRTPALPDGIEFAREPQLLSDKFEADTRASVEANAITDDERCEPSHRE